MCTPHEPPSDLPSGPRPRADTRCARAARRRPRRRRCSSRTGAATSGGRIPCAPRRPSATRPASRAIATRRATRERHIVSRFSVHRARRSRQASGPGENVLRTPNPDLYFHMDADSAGFTQTAVLRHGTRLDDAHRALRIRRQGSGRDRATSTGRATGCISCPCRTGRASGSGSTARGYIDGSLNFDRGISPRCFECHSTWIQQVHGSRRVQPLRHYGRDPRHHLRAVPRCRAGARGARARRCCTR